VKAYESKIILFSSLKVHLEQHGIPTKVEYRIERPGKDPDSPDIFALAEPLTFIEEKGSLPTVPRIAQLEVEKILEYETKHLFEGREFVPQVVLLCPQDVHADKAIMLSASADRLPVLTYEFPVEDPIVLKLRQGSLRSKALESALLDREIPHARKVIPTVKFLRADPPAVYSSWMIWQVLWSFSTTSLNDFTVQYKALIDQCKKFYPGWLGADTEQITYGRANDALDLLSYVGWVEYKAKLSQDTPITVHFAKGDKVRGRALEFLAGRSLELMAKRQRMAFIASRLSGRQRKPAHPTASDSRLDQFWS